MATSSDYLADFMHLDQDLQSVVLYKWHIKLKVEYMKGFLQKLVSVAKTSFEIFLIWSVFVSYKVSVASL